MYRQRINNTVTYTADDIVLFRESPFAAWMERLTLENPQHGIPPDLPLSISNEAAAPLADLIQALSVEDRSVVVIDGDIQEPERNIATLEAMRVGADFIFNGQLTVDTLSAQTPCLMRTSGYSDLGAFLYIPCDSAVESGLNAGFRLSFVAELLQVSQGQLPPQMMIIREGADVVPLLTEDYIYYYRAVQQRFLKAMQSFRKHRMPDPAESSHFGRWSVCASEMFKQRARREQQKTEESQIDETPEESVEMPQVSVASGNSVPYALYDNAVALQSEAGAEASKSAPSMATNMPRSETHYTLAERSMPVSYGDESASRRTPDLASLSWSGTVEGTLSAPSIDAALHNLEFIGSNGPQTPTFNPPSETLQPRRRKYDAIDSDRIDFDSAPLVDMDAISPQDFPPPETAAASTADLSADAELGMIDQDAVNTPSEVQKPATRLFSNSLITSDDVDKY